MKRVVAGLVGLSLALVPTASHAQQMMKLGEVLVLDVLDRRARRRRRQRVTPLPRRSGQPQGTRDSGFGGRVRRPRPSDPRSEPRLVYHLLSPDKVGPLPPVDVLGIHFTKVRPDRRDAFERFVAEKLHPAVGNLRPDLRVLYYKLAGGTDASNYIALFALTKASRDKYWPKGADSDELRAAFSPSVRALTKELSTYLVEGSYAADPKARRGRLREPRVD